MKLSLSSLVAGSAVLAGAIAAATAAPPAARTNPLQVRMVAATGKASDFLGAVEVTVTNTSRHAVRVPNWELPSDFVEAKLFLVTRDGKPVQYEGPMIKRPLPSAADFTVLRPGETRRVVVDLSGAYDLSQTGDYTVTFASPLQHASLSTGEMLKQSSGIPMIAKSAPLRLWVDGSDQLSFKRETQQKGKPGSGGGTVVNGVSYVGCTTTQISGAGNAVVSARSYTEESKGYLQANTQGPRYTTWFGAYRVRGIPRCASTSWTSTRRWTRTPARSRSIAAATRATTPTSIRPVRTRSSSAVRSGARRTPARIRARAR